MPWLLIPSFLVSPGHHQRWNWICRINESLTSIRNDFKYTGHFSAAKFQKKENAVRILNVSSKQFITQQIEYFCFCCIVMIYIQSHPKWSPALQWRHIGRDGVSNHRPHDCLLNRLFRRGSRETWKLRFTGLWEGNSPVTSEFPAQMASNAENVSIWWRHHASVLPSPCSLYSWEYRHDCPAIAWSTKFPRLLSINASR